jgi:hypothetical protein
VTARAHVGEAVALAAGATHVFVFAATSASEGEDRATLGLSGACQTVGVARGWMGSLTGLKTCLNPYPDVDQDAMIYAVLRAAGPKTAVIAAAPGALLTPWRDHAAAVLTPFLPGQAYGLAIAAVLLGGCSLPFSVC